MKAALIRRHLLYRLRRLGVPGLLGVILLTAAGVYWAVVVQPAGARHAQLLENRIAALAQLRAAGPAGIRPATPTEQLVAFYRAFPKGAAIPDWLGTIYSIANEQNLSLELGEYSLTRAKSGRLDQFRIVLPVKGTYPQIRKFIAAALATAPALALDGLFLNRDKISDGNVDARIVFLLYLEKNP